MTPQTKSVDWQLFSITVQVRHSEHQLGDGGGSEAQQGGHAHVGAGHRQGQGEDDGGCRKQGAEEQVQQVQRVHRNASC